MSKKLLKGKKYFDFWLKKNSPSFIKLRDSQLALAVTHLLYVS